MGVERGHVSVGVNVRIALSQWERQETNPGSSLFMYVQEERVQVRGIPSMSLANDVRFRQQWDNYKPSLGHLTEHSLMDLLI